MIVKLTSFYLETVWDLVTLCQITFHFKYEAENWRSLMRFLISETSASELSFRYLNIKMYLAVLK